MYFVATCRMLLVNLSVYVSTSSWFPILSSGLSNSSLNLSLIALFCTWKTVLRCPFILWALCWSGLLLGSGRFLCHRILPIGCPQGLLPLLWSLLRCRLSVDLGLLVWLLRSWVWWIELCVVFYQFHEFSPPSPSCAGSWSPRWMATVEIPHFYICRFQSDLSSVMSSS